MADARQYHDVEDDAEAPDVVRRAVVGNALQDLGRRVRGAAAVRPTQLVRLLWTREAEVGQFHVVLDVQQDVLALQVSSHATRHSIHLFSVNVITTLTAQDPKAAYVAVRDD